MHSIRLIKKTRATLLEVDAFQPPQRSSEHCGSYLGPPALPGLQFPGRFAMILITVWGKFLGRHKHHGFWAQSA